MHLSSSAELLLNDLLVAEKKGNSVQKLLEERVLADSSDSIVRGIIEELKENKCISVLWADNLPYMVELTQVGRTYFEFVDDKQIKDGHLLSAPKKKTYDLFLSHANADKIDYVDELFTILKRLGINIFYDKEELAWGDHWKNRILDGVRESEFAIIVISENFFGREWTERELNHFLHLQNESGQKIILPLLHDIEFSDLKGKYPQLEFIQGIKSNAVTKENIAIMFAKELIKRIKSVPAIKSIDQFEAQSMLIIKGIEDNSLVDDAILESFTISNLQSRENMLATIHSLYADINKIEIDSMVSGKSFIMSLNKPVVINEQAIQIIRLCAERLDIDISTDFFNLGNLSEDVITSSFGDRSFSGSLAEKEKYNKILELEKSIYNFLGRVALEDTFHGFKCINLAVLNCGKNYDEDIDIELFIEKEFFVHPYDLPTPPESAIAFINENSSLEEVFGISGTINYLNYSSSETSKPAPKFVPNLPIFPYSTRDDVEDYKEDLNDVFAYKFFDKVNTTTIKLHLDYIKHNTAVAFPTVLFLSDGVTTIDYKISSKKNTEIIEGSICVVSH